MLEEKSRDFHVERVKNLVMGASSNDKSNDSIGGMMSKTISLAHTIERERESCLTISG